MLFTAATFIAAGLVFMVQPMVAKALLPTFGGAPQVWTAAMLFFQGALLAGYGYAHLSLRRLGPRKQAAVHTVVMLLPLAVLPITLRGVPLTDGLSPALAVLVILALSVGAPYLVVSSTSPLVQRWFSVTGHPTPRIRTSSTRRATPAASSDCSPTRSWWNRTSRSPPKGCCGRSAMSSSSFACVACAVVLRRRTKAGPPTPSNARPRQSHLRRRRRIGGWSGVHPRRACSWASRLTCRPTSPPFPSVGDPLSLYLLTFVIAFAAATRGTGHPGLDPAVPRRTDRPDLPARALAPGVGHDRIHELTFVAALLAHERLADDRPPHLTEFYLLLAFGGVLGGLFNALIARSCSTRSSNTRCSSSPSCSLRPRFPKGDARAERLAKLWDLVAAAAVTLLLVAGLAYLPLDDVNGAGLWAAVVLVLTLVFIRRPTRFAFAVGALLAVTFLAARRTLRRPDLLRREPRDRRRRGRHNT